MTQTTYEILYSKQFSESLANFMQQWEGELGFSEEKIKTFVQNIWRHLQLVKQFPMMHENVAEIYGFDVPTFRILIGKQYALFYRVDESTQQIYVGNMFSQQQMDIAF